MTSLIELAERIEAAEGPDRELGREALLACGWRKTPCGYFLGQLFYWHSPDGKPGFDDDKFASHDPTASIDAALTLVPEGWDWAAGSAGFGAGGHAFLEGDARIETDAATPALALCAAALRAHAVKGEGS